MSTELQQRISTLPQYPPTQLDANQLNIAASTRHYPDVFVRVAGRPKELRMLSVNLHAIPAPDFDAVQSKLAKDWGFDNAQIIALEVNASFIGQDAIMVTTASEWQKLLSRMEGQKGAVVITLRKMPVKLTLTELEGDKPGIEGSVGNGEVSTGRALTARESFDFVMFYHCNCISDAPLKLNFTATAEAKWQANLSFGEYDLGTAVAPTQDEAKSAVYIEAALKVARVLPNLWSEYDVTKHTRGKLLELAEKQARDVACLSAKVEKLEAQLRSSSILSDRGNGLRTFSSPARQEPLADNSLNKELEALKSAHKDVQLELSLRKRELEDIKLSRDSVFQELAKAVAVNKAQLEEIERLKQAQDAPPPPSMVEEAFRDAVSDGGELAGQILRKEVAVDFDSARKSPVSSEDASLDEFEVVEDEPEPINAEK